jgi:hypothetical protein
MSEENLVSFLNVVDKKSGKTFTFRVEGDNRLVLLHPQTKKDFLELTNFNTNLEVRFLDSLKSPKDFSKCILECAKDCNGSALCAAKCVAMCSTIIFD